MYQRIISVLLVGLLLLSAAPTAYAAGPEIAAPSAILMDAATGTAVPVQTLPEGTGFVLPARAALLLRTAL